MAREIFDRDCARVTGCRMGRHHHDHELKHDMRHDLRHMNRGVKHIVREI